MVFLRLDGVRIRATDDEGFVNLVIGVIEGRRAKADVAAFFRERSSE